MIGNIIGGIFLILLAYFACGVILYMVYDDNRYTIENSKILSILWRLGCLVAPLTAAIISLCLLVFGIIYGTGKLLKWFFKCEHDD